MMAIRPISKRTFDALVEPSDKSENLFAEEKAWYETGKGKVLGVVIFDRSEQGWAYTVFLRDEADGQYRWGDAGVGFDSEQLTIEALRTSMQQLHPEPEADADDGD